MKNEYEKNLEMWKETKSKYEEQFMKGNYSVIYCVSNFNHGKFV